MSEDNRGSGRDSHGRFARGVVQNPEGRRKKTPEPAASPLEVLFAGSVTLKTADGTTKQVNNVEAVRHAVLQEAFRGKAAAIKQVTGWVISRQKKRSEKEDEAARRKRAKTSIRRFESDQGNADDALLLLGIATRDEEYEAAVGRPGYRHLKLEPWIIQKALGRRRSSGPMDERDIFEIERCARLPEEIRWPAGARE